MNNIYRLLLFTSLLASQHINAQRFLELFNQKNLDGWDSFEPATGIHDQAGDLFSVEQHMIRLYGQKPGYLVSEQSFHDFKLTVEYRWNTDTSFVRKSDFKNSGIMYLVPAEAPDMLWPKGIQCQVKEGSTGDFIFLQEVTLQIRGKRNTPGKSVVSRRFIDAANPVGEWNKIVITVKNGKIRQQLNGKLVNQGYAPSISEGRILLQYEGYPIDFRRVDIRY